MGHQNPVPQPARRQPWSTGLCDCFEDTKLCCLTCWCPWVTFGRVSEIVDRGTTSCVMNGAMYVLIKVLTKCECVYARWYRTNMRNQYSLEGSTCSDVMTHWCCHECALCQEYRELQHQGYDMSIGWHGNVARQHIVPLGMPAPVAPAAVQGVAVAPPMVHGPMVQN